MRKVILVISIILLIGSRIGPIQGQEVSSQTPLFITGRYREGPDSQALFRYVKGVWEPIVTDNFYGGSISPDNQWLAYLSMPPFLRDREGGPEFWIGTAWDIQLLNLNDLSITTVAVHPESVRIDENADHYSDGITRSIPVWSPDSSAIAWTEQDYPTGDTARLMVFDLNSSTSSVLDDALPQMTQSANGLPAFFSWGTAGIVVFTNDPDDYEINILRFYDETTGLRQTVSLPDAESGWGAVGAPLWIKQSEETHDIVGVQSSDNRCYVVDPITGEVNELGARLEGVSASNPDDSIRLVWNIYALEDEPEWQLESGDGEVLPDMNLDANAPLLHIAFGPSGEEIAYAQSGMLYLWKDHTLAQIDLPEDFQVETINWGQIQWQTGTAYGGVG